MSGDMDQTEAAAPPARDFSVSSFILGIVFAYSASVQLNDIDWYFWLPLYLLASFVCVANTTTRFTATSRTLSRVVLISGCILLVKVVLEGCYHENLFKWKDFISLDMNQRLVREKLGSVLVILSMWSCMRKNAGKTVSKPGSGMRLLSVISTCLCVAYFIRRE